MGACEKGVGGCLKGKGVEGWAVVTRVHSTYK